jgi:hypothetical protein
MKFLSQDPYQKEYEGTCISYPGIKTLMQNQTELFSARRR